MSDYSEMSQEQLLLTVDAKDQRIERLEAALHFYADNHKYPNDGPWGVSSDDFGEVARAALKGEGSASDSTAVDLRQRIQHDADCASGFMLPQQCNCGATAESE